MRRLLSSVILLFFLSSHVVYASSSYVLPYPSAMPGSIFYKIDQVKERLMGLWTFGDFGQFTYNLKESDKYLVEAKTLFDYNQYLLGYQALIKSDNYFRKIEPHIIAAKKHGKNIQAEAATLKEAEEKHIGELTKMKMNVPQIFNWQPEKSKSTNLELWSAIDNSIKQREGAL